MCRQVKPMHDPAISKRERQLIEVAHTIRNGYVYIVGTGLPLAGAALGKRCFAPDAWLIMESGLLDAVPRETPTSVTDLRLMCTSSVLWESWRYTGFQATRRQQGRHNLLAFIGGAQIDAYGNVNSTCIGDYHRPQVRFSGSGGANGIATYVDTIIVMQHDRQRFVPRVDYITSPGWLGGPEGRAKHGLPAACGPRLVISELGVMRFDAAEKRMYLAGYYDFTSPAEIQEHTGFELDVSRAEPLPPATAEVLAVLRREIDPQRMFI